MSLTANDLLEIRNILKEELHEKVDPMRGMVAALENDIKDIYFMLKELQDVLVVKKSNSPKNGLEARLLSLNSQLIAVAKQAGITLPR